MRAILAAVLISAAASASAAPQHPRRRAFCAPAYIEGAGTVRICAPARGR